jgi:branched-chain amino acid transport system substrate-binding protein
MGKGTLIGVFLVALIIGVGIGIGAAPYLAPSLAPKAGLTGEVTIGALLPLTGDLGTFGENDKLSAEIATAEVNQFLQSIGAPWTLKVLVEDTGTNPTMALEKLTSMNAKGIKLVIGPMASGEVRNIKGYADANRILLISQSSTAPDLAVPGDYVYRFCPADTIQGLAIARVMYDLGIRYIVPIWRGDAWGDGLQRATGERFQALGGTMVEGVRYAPEAKEYSAEARNLADKVDSLVKSHGADKVAVYLVAFEEAALLFTYTQEYSVLTKVRWFGSDGTANSAKLIQESAAAGFSMKTKFLNTIFAATKSAKFTKLNSQIVDKLGRTPETYAIVTYDEIWVLAFCLLATQKYDADAVIAAMPTVLGNYFGATGVITLNEGGDRASADYELWEIAIKDGKPTWTSTGTYVFATDSVSWTAT